MIAVPDERELFQRWKQEMEAIGFTAWTPGSAISAMGKVIAAYQSNVWAAIEMQDEQTSYSTARGSFLDKIGNGLGVRRLPARISTTIGKGPTIKFTNNSGTTVTVPAGTRVWNASNPDVAFFTAGTIAVAAGSEEYADAVASGPGESYNVGVGVLTAHNAGMSNLSVTNIRPLGGGSFAESDEEYRYRISLALSSRTGSTENAIRSALLALPGVRDVSIINGARGSGTLDLIIVPIDRIATAALLTACESALTNVIACGISYRVRAPIPIRVDLKVQLTLAPGASLASVGPLVESAVRAYIDNLPLGEGNNTGTLVYNELVSRVQDASPDVVDSSISFSLDGKPSLQTNAVLKFAERFYSGSISIT